MVNPAIKEAYEKYLTTPQEYNDPYSEGFSYLSKPGIGNKITGILQLLRSPAGQSMIAAGQPDRFGKEAWLNQAIARREEEKRKSEFAKEREAVRFRDIMDYAPKQEEIEIIKARDERDKAKESREQTEFEQKQLSEKEMNDPNSKTSLVYQSLAKQYEPNKIFTGMPASVLKPNIDKLISKDTGVTGGVDLDTQAKLLNIERQKREAEEAKRAPIEKKKQEILEIAKSGKASAQDLTNILNMTDEQIEAFDMNSLSGGTTKLPLIGQLGRVHVSVPQKNKARYTIREIK